VRAYFIPRAVLVGAESTGKTTVAQELARRLRTAWVPEHGRTFWDGTLALRTFRPTRDDFIHIAQVQQAMEERLARHADRVLICDTDAFATALWAERYLGVYDERVAALAHGRRAELYLLAGAEIPWVDDGTRERKDERQRLQIRFDEELARQGKQVVRLAGDRDTRAALALGEIEQLIERAM
jgi:NadR type nicotinamide-nucleotide adenylyltransferase